MTTSTDDEPYRTRGFLADYSPAMLAEIRSAAPGLFEFCDELNEVGTRIAWSLRPSRSNPAQIVGALLFVKGLNSFQAALLLAQRGMCVEAEAMARTGIECVFELAAVALDPAHVDALHSAHERHRATHARAMLDQHRDNPSVPLAPEVLSALEEAVTAVGSTGKPKLEQTAKKVGLQALYDASYRGLSGYASHPTFGALQRLLVDEGSVSIQMGPNIDHLANTLISVAPVILEGLLPLAKLFARPELETEHTTLTLKFGKVATPALAEQRKR